MSCRVWSATLASVSTYTASTALPYEHLERATAGLHADVLEMPVWDALGVTGTLVTPPGYVPTEPG